MIGLTKKEQKFSKAEILFNSDFIELGTYEAVRKSLQRLTK